MKVGLFTWGTEGDVRPFFALGHALASRGHAVTVDYCAVEGRSFDALASSLGIRARQVAGEYFREHREALHARARASLTSWDPREQFVRILRDLLDPVAPELLKRGLALAEESDVMVTHFLVYPVLAAVEKVGRPSVTVTLQPMYRSRTYAPVGTPDLGRWLNPLLWRMVDATLARGLQRPTEALRAGLGLAPRARLDLARFGPRERGAVAVSPSLFPRPTDWPEGAAVTGFLSLPEAAEPWDPEGEVRAFLDQGPPVFASFGSMFNLGDQLTREALDVFAGAAERADVRMLVQAPASVVATAPRPPRLCYLQRAPHARLFPRCAAIVHHGGAGTTQSALLAGRPSVVIPHVTDQFFWGQVL